MLVSRLHRMNMLVAAGRRILRRGKDLLGRCGCSAMDSERSGSSPWPPGTWLRRSHSRLRARSDAAGRFAGRSSVAVRRLEWDRKKSLEQRAITVITTSGTLVTLIFALTSVISKGRTFANIVRAERIPLQTSLWLFVAASVLALVTNTPILYRGLRTRYALSLKEDRDPEANTVDAQ